jgi:hypothetical protein
MANSKSFKLREGTLRSSRCRWISGLEVNYSLIKAVIIKTYIDEAGTHGPSPHMTMGAVVGRSNQWTHFNREWDRMLRANGIAYFHTKKWKDTDGPFVGWSREKKAALVIRASDILRDTTCFGMSVKITQSDYKDHYKSGEKPKKIPLDSMYGLCFRYIAIFVMQMAEKTFIGENLEYDFVLESGHKNGGDAFRIFEQLKKDNGLSDKFKSVTFGDKKKFHGLQGADLVSHTTWLAERVNEAELDLDDFPVEGNLLDAEKIQGRRGPTFRIVLTPQILREIKTSKFAWERERIEFGRRKFQK